MNVEIIWRATKLNVEVNSGWTVGELGKKLLQLTNVKNDTLKLLVPQLNGKGSRLLAPFSDDNSGLGIQETGILMGKPIRMMGAFNDEINDVSQNTMRPDLRIAGFDEEEKRLRQLSSYTTHTSLKLPQGPYIFCDFRTLDLPGVKLNPPALKALRIMHILACDPGIIAVMNKHRWRVGIMTEMAPVGYVGISPKCILGFNKNHGEEISLRLRTDDLKGFRKYESIKKTLLHELAHMVYSEHDVKFLFLEKQLNEEAAVLDWTKSRSHSLTGRKVSDHYEDEVGHPLNDAPDTGHKLGGGSNLFATARASSIAAAFDRYSSFHTSNSLEFQAQNEPTHVTALNGCLGDGHGAVGLEYVRDKNDVEPNLDDVDNVPDGIMDVLDDADDVLDGLMEFHVVPETSHAVINQTQISDFAKIESKSDDNDANKVDSDMGLVTTELESGFSTSYSDNMELQRIGEPVAAIVARLRESITFLKSELTTHTAASVLQTLSKIIRNVIEHPEELKFRRIRKTNSHFQRNVANYEAAMEVLTIVGFSEDVEVDEAGEAETYLVLKRNDPGLLWLAKSSLEVFIAG